MRCGGAAQLPLFALAEENPPLRQAIEFYRHAHGWSNRLAAGDSLLVMNSLLEKEGMAGKVQMIYIDPPYGIKYGSNFQPFVNKRDVRDGKDEDLTAEPEQVRAFRDTWELGIHSYLTYLRDRLLLARELLNESGSVFVQISDENVHHVRELMDEVFGQKNFIAAIAYRLFGIRAGKFLDNVTDNLLWYGRDKEKAKYRQLFLPPDEIENEFYPVRLYRPGFSEGLSFDFMYGENTYSPPSNMHWATGFDGLQRLAIADRLIGFKADVRYKRYCTDFPHKILTTSWQDTWGEQEKNYVVQTSYKVIERCLLMTTDPGDLVFDPTCVRRGTRVCVPSPALPANGEGGISSPRKRGDARGVDELRGDTVPVESLQAGQWVIAHDGQPHRVRRVIRKSYRGQMVGIRHFLCESTLWLTADHRVLAKARPRSLGGQRNWAAIPANHWERSRQLRKEMTTSERKLWNALRNKQLGWKFRRQHPIGAYIVDFYAREAHLVIEVDGSSHFSEEAIAYDGQREAHLRALGLDVLRFTNSEVEENLAGVCLAIENHCHINAETWQGAQWMQAGALQPGDVVFFGVEGRGVPLTGVESVYTEEEVFDFEIEGAHSFLTEVCAVHNCGSGTTAYVAEQRGRRWITCDTSRVALTLAKQSLMTAVFDFYELAHPEEGVGSGFVYKTVPHVPSNRSSTTRISARA